MIGSRFLDKEDQPGQEDGDHADGRCKSVVRGRFTKEGRVNEHRECGVALADERGRAKVSKGAHEHQKRCGQNGRHGEHEDDPDKTAHTAAAQIGRGLHQTVVNV